MAPCAGGEGKQLGREGLVVTKTREGVRVEIYDQEYFMRGELDAEYIQKLAAYLDSKMRSIADRTHTIDSLRVAILAALNIADEYHQLKAKHESMSHLSDKISSCNEVLDEILREAS